MEQEREGAIGGEMCKQQKKMDGQNALLFQACTQLAEAEISGKMTNSMQKRNERNGSLDRREQNGRAQ